MSERKVSSNEAWYDAEVAPQLLALAKACQARGLNFIAHVEWAPDEAGTTRALNAGARSANVALVDLATRCRGNLDLLCMTAARHVRESGRGHSSIVLNMMGVPTRAAEPPPAERGGRERGATS